MAYETETTNFKKPDFDLLSVVAIPSFQEKAQLFQHCLLVPFGLNKTVCIGKEGYFVAGTQATEVAEYVFDAGDEYSEDGVTITAAIIAQIHKPSFMSERFASQLTPPSRVAELKAEALAREADATFVSLFDDITNNVVSSGVLTLDHLVEASYEVMVDTKRDDAPLHAVLDRKQILELRKEQSSSQAAFYAVPGAANLLTGDQKKGAGYVGNFAGVDVYSYGLTAVSGSVVGSLFVPQLAFATAWDPNIYQIDANKISEGLYAEKASIMYINSAVLAQGAACQVKSAKE